MVFSDEDRRQLDARGITPEEAGRQLTLLDRPPRYAELERPCTVGDGIERIDEGQFAGLLEAHAAAARQGRFLKFVPASGAASRMFKHLLYFQRGPGRELAWPAIERRAAEDPASAALVEFLAEIRRFAFYADLRRTVFRRGEDLDALARVGAFQPVLDALLGEDGMNYDALPKGLLKFHAYEDRARTPFEEHLVEAADYTRDAAGRCRLHFTVSPEHRPGFQRLLDEVGDAYGRGAGASFDVGWSVQKPSTDTLAADDHGRPLRGSDGRMLLRPGGHGALIENLDDLAGDLVYVKNIDNVQPDRAKVATLLWKKLLGGYLVKLQGEVFGHLNRLREADPSDDAIHEAERFVGGRLGLRLDARKEPPTFQARRACLIARLNRPLRVCGAVANTGEPGGGPFWVRGPDGASSRQIVESAQIDPARPAQNEIFRSSSHFNPVDLVCGVRDAARQRFPLAEFVDREAVIVTRKSEGGREVRALERPGLWNGAMAGWITIFVEVPIETFSPVKSVLDLLRPEHQP